jgi:hypothetical protein
MLRAVWTDSKQSYERIIHNAEQGLDLVAELAACRSDSPVMLEFIDLSSRASLAVGVGRPHTVVTFQQSPDPPYYISLGDASRHGTTSFCYGNEETEYLLRNAVSLDEGQQALSCFVSTHSKPTNLNWEKL